MAAIPLITSSAAGSVATEASKAKATTERENGENLMEIMMKRVREGTQEQNCFYTLNASRKRKISESLEAGLEAVKRGNR